MRGFSFGRKKEKITPEEPQEEEQDSITDFKDDSTLPPDKSVSARTYSSTIIINPLKHKDSGLSFGTLSTSDGKSTEALTTSTSSSNPSTNISPASSFFSTPQKLIDIKDVLKLTPKLQRTQKVADVKQLYKQISYTSLMSVSNNNAVEDNDSITEFTLNASMPSLEHRNSITLKHDPQTVSLEEKKAILSKDKIEGVKSSLNSDQEKEGKPPFYRKKSRSMDFSKPNSSQESASYYSAQRITKWKASTNLKKIKEIISIIDILPDDSAVYTNEDPLYRVPINPFKSTCLYDLIKLIHAVACDTYKETQTKKWFQEKINYVSLEMSLREEILNFFPEELRKTINDNFFLKLKEPVEEESTKKSKKEVSSASNNQFLIGTLAELKKVFFKQVVLDLVILTQSFTLISFDKSELEHIECITIGDDVKVHLNNEIVFDFDLNAKNVSKELSYFLDMLKDSNLPKLQYIKITKFINDKVNETNLKLLMLKHTKTLKGISCIDLVFEMLSNFLKTLTTQEKIKLTKIEPAKSKSTKRSTFLLFGKKDDNNNNEEEKRKTLQ